jgi:hypothetical protein
VPVEAVRERGAPAAVPCFNLGTAICGNRAIGASTAGNATAVAGGLIAARIEAPIMLAYGRQSAIIPRIANQARWRRVPRPLRPNVPDVPTAAVPAGAGVRCLCNPLLRHVRPHKQLPHYCLARAPSYSVWCPRAADGGSFQQTTVPAQTSGVKRTLDDDEEMYRISTDVRRSSNPSGPRGEATRRPGDAFPQGRLLPWVRLGGRRRRARRGLAHESLECGDQRGRLLRRRIRRDDRELRTPVH